MDYKKKDNNACWREFEPFSIAGENIKWSGCFGKQFDSFRKMDGWMEGKKEGSKKGRKKVTWSYHMM